MRRALAYRHLLQQTVRNWEATISNYTAGTEAFSRSCSSVAEASSSSEVEEEEDGEWLPVLRATLRNEAGTSASNKLRKAGQVPAILFSLPEEQSTLLALNPREVERVVKAFGRQGITCRVMTIEVKGEDGETTLHRVLPRQVHANAATDKVENVTFIHCPPERMVRVRVPVTVRGEDACPGVKAGGFVSLVQRGVRLLARGDSVPPLIELDVSQMQVGEIIRVRDLPLPGDVKLLEKHPMNPVCKIGGRVRRAGASDGQ